MKRNITRDLDNYIFESNNVFLTSYYRGMGYNYYLQKAFMKRLLKNL